MTVFIPYHSESKESALDNETSTLTTQLEEHGKKKGCRKKEKLQEYMKEKIEMFLDQQSEDSFKVVLFTLVGSEKLNYLEVWDDLLSVLDEQCKLI